MYDCVASLTHLLTSWFQIYLSMRLDTNAKLTESVKGRTRDQSRLACHASSSDILQIKRKARRSSFSSQALVFARGFRLTS